MPLIRVTDILSKLKKTLKKKSLFRSLNETAEDLYKQGKILGISGLKTWHLCKIVYLSKSWRRIRNCNHFYNNLRLFDILPSFPFTPSDKKRNYQ